jgi:hypothetical protein
LWVRVFQKLHEAAMGRDVFAALVERKLVVNRFERRRLELR